MDIIGRAKVIAETIIDEQQAKQAGEKAGKKAGDGVAEGGKEGGSKFSSNFESVVGKSLPLAAVGVGAAVGTALAYEIGKSLERESSGARLAASLGLDASGTAEINKAASQIYREAWGESFAAVQQGVAATKSSFRDLSGEELTEAARNAQIFADIFQVDVVQAAGVASVAVKNGLAVDAVEAFDLMTAAAQQVPIQFRDELLEAVTEYSQFFSQIGIDGPEAFALLAEGAALGQYGIDKTGDAIKEFGIRAIDTSALTAEAFATLNLDIQTMQDALTQGGEAGEKAFRQIVQGLADIEDPSEQAATAIALFGTPIEDLGNEQIPIFIESLANANTQLDNHRGATKRAGEQSTTFSEQIKALARTLDEELGDAIGAANKGIGSLWQNWIELASRVGDNPIRVPGNTVSQPASTRAVGGPASGLTLVGERGPELLALPAGSYVHSNANSREMVAASSGGGDTFNINYVGSMEGLVRELDWRSRYRRVGA